MMAVPPELSPGLPGSRNSGTELFGKSLHEEPFGDSRARNHAGRSPVGLTGVAQVTTDNRRRPTVMLGGRKFIVQSRWPGRLAVLLWRKLRDRSASLETAETLRDESFSDRPRPYLNPERATG
jgi:hypothetical protein